WRWVEILVRINAGARRLLHARKAGFRRRAKSAISEPAAGTTAALGRNAYDATVSPYRQARRADFRPFIGRRGGGAEIGRPVAHLSSRQPGQHVDPRGGDELDRDPDDGRL